MTVETIDLNDYEMPIYSIDRQNDGGIPQLAHDFFDKIGEADAVLISFAEHKRLLHRCLQEPVRLDLTDRHGGLPEQADRDALDIARSVRWSECTSNSRRVGRVLRERRRRQPVDPELLRQLRRHHRDPHQLRLEGELRAALTALSADRSGVPA